jgi:tetratricopeptide (TPR) repeat protein
MSLDVTREAGLRYREGQVLFNLGNAHWSNQSGYELANRHWQEAALIFRQVGAKNYLAFSKQMSASSKISLGKFEEAERELNEVRDIYSSLDNIQSMLYVDLDLASLTLDRGLIRQAQKQLHEILDASADYSYIHGHAASLLSIVYLNLNQIDKASEYLSLSQQLEWFDSRPSFVFIPASIEHAKGNFKTAVETAIDIRERLQDSWTDEHEKVLMILRSDLRNDTSSIDDYGNILPLSN